MAILTSTAQCPRKGERTSLKELPTNVLAMATMTPRQGDKACPSGASARMVAQRVATAVEYMTTSTLNKGHVRWNNSMAVPEVVFMLVSAVAFPGDFFFSKKLPSM